MHRSTLIAVAFLTVRCATIAHGRFQQVPVTSDPAGAEVRVTCGDGAKVAGVTPTIATLRRNAPACSITIVKAGFADRVLQFERVTSAWFWANLAFPGLVAELAVELSTGPPIVVFSDTQTRDHQINGAGFAGGTAAGMLIDHSTGAQYRFVPARVDAVLERQK